MEQMHWMSQAARNARPVYAPFGIGAVVRLPLPGAIDAVVVDIDGANGGAVCAWRQKSSYFESWLLAAHLQRVR